MLQYNNVGNGDDWAFISRRMADLEHGFCKLV